MSYNVFSETLNPQSKLSAYASPQPKQHLNRFSRLCTDDRRVSLLFTMVYLFPPQNCPLPMLASGPHVIRGSLGPPESGTQMVT